MDLAEGHIVQVGSAASSRDKVRQMDRPGAHRIMSEAPQLRFTGPLERAGIYSAQKGRVRPQLVSWV